LGESVPTLLASQDTKDKLEMSSLDLYLFKGFGLVSLLILVLFVFDESLEVCSLLQPLFA